MTITLTIPDDAIPAEQARVDQYNQGSGQPPLTIQQFAQLERDELTTARVRAKADADRAALAGSDELVQLGLDVRAATPEKRAAAVEAARRALEAGS